jgi:hypothetical protein
MVPLFCAVLRSHPLCELNRFCFTKAGAAGAPPKDEADAARAPNPPAPDALPNAWPAELWAMPPKPPLDATGEEVKAGGPAVKAGGPAGVANPPPRAEGWPNAGVDGWPNPGVDGWPNTGVAVGWPNAGVAGGWPNAEVPEAVAPKPELAAPNAGVALLPPNAMGFAALKGEVVPMPEGCPNAGAWQGKRTTEMSSSNHVDGRGLGAIPPCYPQMQRCMSC